MLWDFLCQLFQYYPSKAKAMRQICYQYKCWYTDIQKFADWMNKSISISPMFPIQIWKKNNRLSQIFNLPSLTLNDELMSVFFSRENIMKKALLQSPYWISGIKYCTVKQGKKGDKIHSIQWFHWMHKWSLFNRSSSNSEDNQVRGWFYFMRHEMWRNKELWVWQLNSIV